MHDRKETAARAAWLYFVRGYTQDEVAWHLGLSRPTTQRLISFAVSEELVRFKINHPIVGCIGVDPLSWTGSVLEFKRSAGASFRTRGARDSRGRSVGGAGCTSPR